MHVRFQSPVHISTNLEGEDAKWPFQIKTPDKYADKKKTQVLVPGENRSLSLEPGDGLLYKGCERPHWREANAWIKEEE